MKEIKIFCPATIANLSCGFDVLGLALESIGDEMLIKKTSKPGIHITKITTFTPLTPINPLATALPVSPEVATKTVTSLLESLEK